jgi:hypothetical protein
MADISADALIPSGEFAALEASTTQVISSGASGTLATLPATGGRRIRLTMLSVAPSGSESGITIVADGVTVVSSKTLTPSIQASNSFTIGYGVDSSARPFIGNIKQIEARTSIVISKASGSTTANIYYATEQGF